MHYALLSTEFGQFDMLVDCLIPVAVPCGLVVK